MGFAFGEVGNEVAKSMASKTGWDVNGAPGHPDNDPASNNGSEFNGYPSGLRGEDGFFFNSGMEVYWWTSTPDLMSPGIATNFGVSNNHREVYATLNTYKVGHYIRCVKD